MTINWIASSQPSDSLSTYPVQKYKLWKLIAVYNRVASCDSLVAYQEKLIQMGLKIQEKADSLLAVRLNEIQSHVAMNDIWEKRFENQREALIAEMRKTKLWKLGCAGLALLLILALL